MQKSSYAGAFDALCYELAAMREARQKQAANREMADRHARQQSEAQRNRRLAASRATKLVKSIRTFIAETPAKVRAMRKALPAPANGTGDGLRTAVENLNATHAAIQQRRIQERQEQALRDKLTELYTLAKAGQLAPADVCRLDAIRCRAVDMGLRP